MDIKYFIKNIAKQFHDSESIEFKPDTIFQDLEGYTSLTALFIILMIDEEYGVSIDANELTSSETIEDLYNKVKAKV